MNTFTYLEIVKGFPLNSLIWEHFWTFLKNPCGKFSLPLTLCTPRFLVRLSNFYQYLFCFKIINLAWIQISWSGECSSCDQAYLLDPVSLNVVLTFSQGLVLFLWSDTWSCRLTACSLFWHDFCLLSFQSFLMGIWRFWYVCIHYFFVNIKFSASDKKQEMSNIK
jgi:hypothetical protein